MSQPSADVAALDGLAPAVAERLQLYVDLLRRWQATINLIAPSTLTDVWSRHVADSLQVGAAVPTARRWIDFGSGGGFPGLVTAIGLHGESDATIHLVESDKRKAAFLRTVSRETGACAQVHCARIEDFIAGFNEPIDAISARALAPLPILLDYAAKYLDRGAVGVFPKGQQAEAELTAVAANSRFRIASVPSRTQATARLLLVTVRPPSELQRGPC